MNKKDIAAEINKLLNTSKAESERIVDALFEAIMMAVKKGEVVAIAGFGKFMVKKRDARMGRNPKTGEAVKIAASKKLKFSAAKNFKELVK